MTIEKIEFDILFFWFFAQKHCVVHSSFFHLLQIGESALEARFRLDELLSNVWQFVYAANRAQTSGGQMR